MNVAMKTYKALFSDTTEDATILMETEKRISECFQYKYSRYFRYDDRSYLSIYASKKVIKATLITRRAYDHAKKHDICLIVKNGERVSNVR